MKQAMLNGIVVAESDRTVVSREPYFPIADVNSDYSNPRDAHHLPVEGNRVHYSVAAPGATAGDGAWYYPTPSPAAQDRRPGGVQGRDRTA